MPAFRFSLGRSTHCKSEPSEVHEPSDPRANNLSESNTRKPFLCGCSRSISNLRDVIHGSKRHTEKPTSCSPRSVVSNDSLNSLRREAGGWSKKIYGDSPIFYRSGCLSSRTRGSLEAELDFYDFSSLVCKRCRENFKNLDAVEAHHLSQHAVSELAEGDSSRRIVEIIFRTSWLNPETQCVQIERVLKVHNLQTAVARFEECRDMVKIRAGKLATKHPRCLADGNELMRFYGSTVACSLGIDGSSGLCTVDACGVCRILRHGFTQKDITKQVGVYTTSTSGLAFKFIETDDGRQCVRKALLVCRVIAGRVHRPLENFQEMSGQVGFDSLAGKVGPSSKIEELFVLNPRALLPCFVVLCKL